MESVARKARIPRLLGVIAAALACMLLSAPAAQASIVDCAQVLFITTSCPSDDPTSGSPDTVVPTPSSTRSSGSTPGASPSSAAQPQTRIITKTKIERVVVYRDAPAQRVVQQPPAPPLAPAGGARPASAGGIIAAVALLAFGALIFVRRMDAARSRDAEAVEQLKRDILANVSHELRTPLTPVKGYADMLSRKELPRAKTKQFADAIVEASTRLERVIEAMTTLAEMTSGSRRIARDPIDVSALTTSSIGGIDHLSRGRVHVTIPVEPMSVVGDGRLLRMALLNLIENAMKFSTGEVRVEVSRRGADVTVEVIDRGMGIAADDLRAIFDDLHQVDPSATRRHGGLGVGLSLVKRIVDAHGGTVTARSAPGMGSTFAIELPAAEREAVRTRPLAPSSR